jgi:opacity protein-like surface antigen
VKKIYVLAMVLLVAAVVALPGAAQSAMWIGGELGGNILGNNSIDATLNTPGIAANATASNVKWDNPTVIGGITIGYDFVKTGFAGYDWPDWMKYFSFATDFTYNRNVIRSQTVNVSGTVNGTPFSGTVPLNTLVPGGQLDGYTAALSFLFMAHYGFYPDSEVPSGRVNPYIAVGPGILFSGLDAGAAGVGSHSATNVALVTEAGVRFMALKNVSLDAGFRYRYAAPSYSYSGNFGGTPVNANLSTTINSFSFLFRANYHF